ncbi:alpha/beta hydrolase [Umezawaea endophytica]|uniref:Alpha/beta hydrolase n=1 Tax=Umezawaea endophytica TaxID=1654476 RepID=A0A9X3A0P8_9PSEU|nr:alpha/beta hydrolase [Umezawaea endophytica]MCS7478784.1 alpha/beta hydrolase [Umezawaea endophytica]
MREVDVAIAADDGVLLAGTLTLPVGVGPHPAVLLLHGSGRLDRDANAGRLRMGFGPAVAAALAAVGIAVLRYDRRGVGATAGDWLSTGFVDNRRDAVAALRALAGRDDVRAEAVGVVGHSEGAVHAMALGSRPEVAAVVLLAGFARTGEDALRWQARTVTGGLPAPVRSVLRGIGNRQLARIKASGGDVVRVVGTKLNARWMREMLVHDSRSDLANVRVPVLAITGGKDVQVDPADLDRIRELVPGEVEVHRIPDLTHLLRRDQGRSSVRSYPAQLRRPVDADLLAQVTDWLARKLGA